MAGRHHVEPFERVRFFAGRNKIESAFEPFSCGAELAGERLRDFGADFVAARADGRAERGDDVGGARAEGHAHLAERFLHDARERAAPAGVDGGDGAAARVGKQDRDAVGGLHGEQEARRLRDERVGARRLGGDARTGENVDHVGVKLARGDEGPIGGAERGGETQSARGDRRARIVFRET